MKFAGNGIGAGGGAPGGITCCKGGGKMGGGIRTPAGVTVGQPSGRILPGDPKEGGGGDGESSSSTCSPI